MAAILENWEDFGNTVVPKALMAAVKKSQALTVSALKDHQLQMAQDIVELLAGNQLILVCASRQKSCVAIVSSGTVFGIPGKLLFFEYVI